MNFDDFKAIQHSDGYVLADSMLIHTVLTLEQTDISGRLQFRSSVLLLSF